jgi:hypothetical protein
MPVVRSEEVADTKSVNDLSVPTSDSVSLKRKRYLQPRAHPASAPLSPDVCQRDDGMWSIGWHDEAAGPFPTRTFAHAVALADGRVSP